MGRCQLCQQHSSLIAAVLGLCLACIRNRPKESRKMAIENHGRIRQEWGLPPQAPASADGIKCDFCVNRCRIDDGGRGYCGLRQNIQGQLEGVTAHRGKLSWYHDPLPTNCVGDWICPGGTGCGYPTFAYKEGPDYGY